MNLEHHYATSIEWAGNRGTGTSAYKAYGRETVISAAGKESIDGSSDRVFHGNPERWNPEELLISALSECHLLSYLHVAATNGIVVTAYTDDATGTLVQTADGGGHISTVTLRPRVTISGGDAELALALHAEARKKCFIAASVNFPVLHEPEILVVPA
ncbi:organic hydroperoxide reductase OsmC/OhrA [Conyzicola lurida]|uniref:Organic hydroperoxide reductase OsmC/OhrA n=1 Tax=Conyzicola lurida TaxID=1172621 RepID=A0A841AFY5_9MICO|nr:OsmC family protein [Conyzicola lurida]MBB5842710.1 organic hydroperoxide reductase OsmC/OhrA [Conyzicola lurida]